MKTQVTLRIWGPGEWRERIGEKLRLTLGHQGFELTTVWTDQSVSSMPGFEVETELPKSRHAAIVKAVLMAFADEAMWVTESWAWADFSRG